MFAVQFGININNFFFGPSAGASAGAALSPTTPTVAQAPAAQQSTPPATAPQTPVANVAADLPAASLPSDLQRAGLGISPASTPVSSAASETGLVHVVTNATSSLAGQFGSAGLTSAAGGVFDPASFFAGSAGNSAASAGFGIPVALVPIFLNGQGGFSLGPVPAFPTTAQTPQPAPVTPTPTATETPAAPAPVAVVETPVPETTLPEVELPPATTVIQVPAEAFDTALQSANRSSVDTELTLSLLTQDGDEIQLDFRQLDVLVQLGDDAEGERDSQTERLVDISITGTLDDGERAALDEVIASVLAVAEQFLGGDLDATRSAIQDLAFDSSELAELSLRLSVARSVTVDDAYGGDLASFAALTDTSAEAASILEFFANEQRTLIDTARETLSDASSVQLVSSLLPALVSEPLDLLAQRIDSQELPEPADPDGGG